MYIFTQKNQQTPWDSLFRLYNSTAHCVSLCDSFKLEKELIAAAINGRANLS